MIAVLVDVEVAINLSSALAAGINSGVARNEHSSAMVKGGTPGG